ncbi:MAG: PD-(D/E)XK nuclease family protein [Syntrophorhabdus sp.]
MNTHEHITHLSASAINDYTECGLLFKLGRIDKVPMEFTPDALEFGSAIHKALATFYEEKMTGNILSLNELCDLFVIHWEKAVTSHPDIKYGKGKNSAFLRTHGRELLGAYYRNLPDDLYTVLAVEEYFEFYIEGLDVPIIGYIDLMEEDESGTIVITDWKTAAKAYSFDEVNKNFQLTLYTVEDHGISPLKAL